MKIAYFRNRVPHIAAAIAISTALSCTPVEPDPVVGPQGPTDLAVTATADPPSVFEGFGVTLTATATGGTGTYAAYRWDQNDGPEDLALQDVTSVTLETGAMATPGRYQFRVTVTDSDGDTVTGFVAVEVGGAVSAEAPRLVVVGEPAELSATITADDVEVTLLWEVVSGDGSIDDPTATDPTLTAGTGETLQVRLTATMPSDAAEPIATTREFDIVAVDDLSPRVLVETNNGQFTLQLDGEAAPLHTANLLQYVDEGFFDGLLFHRIACTPDSATGECSPFVLQGGGYERNGEEVVLREPTHDPAESEAGNGLTSAELYSLSLALSGGNTNSGTTQFFINLADNGFLDDQGFTTFGSVVDGTDVVDAIVAMEVTESPILGGEPSFPVEDVTIERMIRESQQD